MLEGVLGRVRDLRGNHFALIQMTLFMLLHLVHRLGKGVKRKENQVGKFSTATSVSIVRPNWLSRTSNDGDVMR